VPHVVNRIPPPPARAVPAENVPAPRTSETDDSIARIRVQSVIDELSHAREVIDETVDYAEFFWDRDLSTSTWSSFSGLLSGERGFGATYALTREAYRAVEAADEVRRDHEDSTTKLLTWEEDALRGHLEQIDKALDSLGRYLTSRGG
jgi:hypothetical protein